MIFDHRAPGTPATEWQPIIDAAVPLVAPSSGDHVVVVAAHPDDETLGAGGLMTCAARRGAQVTVIVASDGEASHPSSPTHRPDELASLRRQEVSAALAVLAPAATVLLLGLPDGKLSAYRPQISAAIDEAGAGCTHLVTPWSGDEHPDHAACAQAASDSIAALHAQHWQFPIWAWHWGDPGNGDLPVATLGRVELDAAACAAKSRALDCHESQHRALSDCPGDEPILGPDVLDHFRRDVEAFFVAPPPARTPDTYFDSLYERDVDPWGLASRFYERRKRAIVLAALTRPRFRRVFEPGCATGLLTEELAERCDEVVAWDIAAAAVQQTSVRAAHCRNVSVAQGAVPDDWPDGKFDLIVLSEVGYYCADPGSLAARIDESLEHDGVLVACHWRHPASMHLRSAEAVHAALNGGRQLLVTHVEDDFLLQVWSRNGRSVAATDGIIA